jgi:phage regulator Rha-like protein
MITLEVPELVNAGAVDLALVNTKDEVRVDSRVLAQHLGNQHHSMIEHVKNYLADFEVLGKVRFETEALHGSKTGQSVKFVLLNEDQSFLLLTYSRNTARVRQLKLKLIQAFRAARQAVTMRQVEYLPTYHRLHETVHQLAEGSSNEKFVHINVNKLVNRAVGLDAGQRSTAALPQQAMLIVCQDVATQAMRGAADHRVGYQRAKQSLEALNALMSVSYAGDGHA